MAHSEVRNQLIDLANSSAGNPMGYLEGLSDIHDDWHTEVVRTYGFLMFHHRVVRDFNAIVNTQIQPQVTAYAASDFPELNVQLFSPNLANVNTLAALADLSREIESWHNIAHARIGSATQTPMMDPRQNIFFRPFWRLHLFIEGFFQTGLQQYGDQVHPGQFLAVDAVAGHIEASHHAWVPAI